MANFKIPSYETVDIKQLKTAFQPRNYKVYLPYVMSILKYYKNNSIADAS